MWRVGGIARGGSLLLLFQILAAGCSPFGGGSIIPAEFHPGVGAYVVEVTDIFPTGSAVNGGTRVRITGTQFREGATVLLGDAECSEVDVVSETELTCLSTAHVGATVDVHVTNEDGQAGTFRSGFVYSAAFVTVTSVSSVPTANPGELLVVIFGSNFQSGATVTIGGNPCTPVTFVNSEELRCTITPQPATGSDVIVTNPGGGSRDTGGLPGGYAVGFSANPILQTLSTSEGTTGGGTMVTITGNFFVSGATVLFGADSCTPVTFVSSTQLRCPTPPHAAGTVTVTVTNPDARSGILADSYTYGTFVYASEINSDAPVIYYRLNEAPGGSLAFDTAGHPSGASNGMYVGAVVRGTAGPFASDGTSKSARFSGAPGDRIGGVAGGGYAKITANVAHTVELWVKPLSVTSTPLLVSVDTGTPFDWLMQLGPGKVYWSVAGSAGTLRQYSASLVGAWHHLVFVKFAAATEGDFYLDGVKQTTFTGTLGQTPAGNLSILIGGFSNGNNVLDGHLAEMAFYNYALPESRIKFHYQIGIGQ